MKNNVAFCESTALQKLEQESNIFWLKGQTIEYTTDEKTLNYFLNKPGVYFSRLVARHPNATIKMLRKLLNDKDFFIRWDTVHHFKMNYKLLQIALQDDDRQVVKQTLLHPNLPEELRILHMLRN
jgi:hypothetical protein